MQKMVEWFHFLISWNYDQGHFLTSLNGSMPIKFNAMCSGEISIPKSKMDTEQN